VAALVICFLVWRIPTPGDIATALSRHPKAYTLSLGHMEDLTFDSFAYLRVPLLVAGIAFLIGCLGTIRQAGQRAFLAAALMMVLFFHAARLALVVFEPYLSSRPIAEALMQSPEGELIVDHFYYTFSSVIFYTNRTALLLNGRKANFEYGANAPDAPPVFINDAQFKNLWLQPSRYYVVAEETEMPRFENLVGATRLNVVATSGGKLLMTNHPLTSSNPPTNPGG
jgi:hypothetical protein